MKAGMLINLLLLRGIRSNALKTDVMLITLHAFEGTTDKSPEEYERLLDSVRIAIEVSLRRKQ